MAIITPRICEQVCASDLANLAKILGLNGNSIEIVGMLSATNQAGDMRAYALDRRDLFEE